MEEIPPSSRGLTDTGALLQSVVDAFPDPMFVKDREHRFIATNRAFCDLLGKPPDRLLGLSDRDFFPADQVDVFWRIDDQVITTGAPHAQEEQLTDGSGQLHGILTRKFPLRDSGGATIGVCGVITDVTPLKQRERQAAWKEESLQQAALLVEEQALLLEQFATPVIQIWKGMILLPLVGAIDDRRATSLLQTLLPEVARVGARIAILDVTGVPSIDSSIAGHLLRAIGAAQLLGCRSILVGIRPEIATTLVRLDVSFQGVTTRATLQNGLEEGLRALDYVVRKGPDRREQP